MRWIFSILFAIGLAGAISTHALAQPNSVKADAASDVGLSIEDIDRLNDTPACTDEVFLPRSGDKCVIENAKCLDFRISREGEFSETKRGTITSAWNAWQDHCEGPLEIAATYCRWGKARGKRYVCAELKNGQYRYRAIATPCFCRDAK